jgi:hypothetical protein
MNTGPLTAVSFEDPTQNVPPLNCPILFDNTLRLCGDFPSIGTYRVIAATQGCGIMSATFSDALGGEVTRTVFCDN